MSLTTVWKERVKLFVDFISVENGEEHFENVLLVVATDKKDRLSLSVFLCVTLATL